MSHKLNARTWHVPQKSTVQTVYPVPRGMLQNLGPHDEGKNTYVVIVNKGDAPDTSCDTKTLKPCFRLKKGLPKVRLKMESHVESEHDFVDTNSASLSSKNVGDDVKLNLSDMGFEDYDSTTSAQNVFRDYNLDENQALDLTKKSKPTHLKISETRSYKLSSDDDNQERNDPFLSPIPGSFQILQPSSTATPVGTRMDLSGSSGYNSACSPYLQSNFETPSPVGGSGGGTSSNKQSAARQIFLISPSNVQSDGASPISCLSAGLKNVAVLQSPSETTAAPTSKTYQIGSYNYSTANASEVPTVAINPSFLTSTPITHTLTSSRTEALTSVKPFNVKLPILKRGAVSASPTLEMGDLAQKSENNCCDKTKPKIESYGNMVMHFDCKASENIVKIEFDTSLKEDNEAVSVATASDPGSTDVLGSSQEFVPRSLQSESLPSSSQESMESQDSAAATEKESLDDSLTNMQWLRGIKLKKNEKEEKPESTSTKSKDKDASSNSLQWRYLSPADIKRISQECGKTKRPPFSYMSLIQMALNSTEEKKMTLREICKWIETTFMYYKSTAKPGWKNSIRHNLSLYSIFEREKSKKHGSYWTMKEDCPEKAKVTPSNKDKKDSSVSGGNMVSPMIPFPLIPASFFSNSQSGLQLPLPKAGSIPFPQSTAVPTIPVVRDPSQRKGPQPILPRPCMYSSAPLQTYALIPIQNVGQNVQQAINSTGQTNQPMIVQVPPENNNSTQSASVSSNVQQMMEQADIQRKIKKKKMITIAPKVPLTSSSDSSVNIVKQAWLDAQNLTSDSDTEWAATVSKAPSIQIEEKTENLSPDKDLNAKKAKIKLPLPKPKFFNKKTPPSKKTRSRRKQTLVAKERSLMHDSSDEESDFVANLEKELPTPLKNILDKTEKSPESMATSTPFKSMGFSSPQLPSPIRGFTPLKNSMFMDGLFLDSDTDVKGFVISPDILRYKKMSPSVLRTPDSPNLDFNITPIKSSNMQDTSINNGHSLSKFIAEFPIDSELMEEGDGLPADLSNLNWSVGQQLDNDS